MHVQCRLAELCQATLDRLAIGAAPLEQAPDAAEGPEPSPDAPSTHGPGECPDSAALSSAEEPPAEEGVSQGLPEDEAGESGKAPSDADDDTGDGDVADQEGALEGSAEDEAAQTGERVPVEMSRLRRAYLMA